MDLITEVRRVQTPVNAKFPPALVAMPTPAARGLRPKFPATETGQKTRFEKPQQRTRSVDNPPPPEKTTRSVDNPPPLKQAEKKAVVPPSGKIVTPNLKMFILVDLKTATKNFRSDSIIGEGGFGQVYKGWVDEKTLAPTRAGVGIPVAVKKSNPDSAQGLHEWQASNSKFFLFFFFFVFNFNLHFKNH